MRFLERVFFFLFIFGIVWQSYYMFCFIAIPGLALLYFIFGFLLNTGIRINGIFKKESYQAVSAFDIIMGSIAGITHSIMLMGIIEKIEIHPAATYMLSGGLIFSLILALLAFLTGAGIKSKLFINILGRTLVVVIICFSILHNPFSLFR